MNKLVTHAKQLRERSTQTEKSLWKHLRAKQMDGLKFRRQEPIGPFIVDFVCFEKKVIIECDGGQHASQVGKDKERDQWFEDQGYKILRFWNNEVLGNMQGVLEVIQSACRGHPPLSSPPIKGGER